MHKDAQKKGIVKQSPLFSWPCVKIVERKKETKRGKKMIVLCTRYIYYKRTFGVLLFRCMTHSRTSGLAPKKMGIEKKTQYK